MHNAVHYVGSIPADAGEVILTVTGTADRPQTVPATLVHASLIAFCANNGHAGK